VKFAGYQVIDGNPLPGADPQVIAAVFSDYVNKIMREGVGVFQNISKHLEVITIIAVQPIISTKPHKTMVVLENAPDRIIGKTPVYIQPGNGYGVAGYGRKAGCK
jgi:hypothetical protein